MTRFTLALSSLTLALALAAPAGALAQSAAPAQAAPPASVVPVAGALVAAKEDAATTDLAKKVFESMQRGKPDRTLFSDAMNATLSDQMLARGVKELGQLDAPEWTYLGQSAGDSPRQVYRLKFKQFALILQARLEGGKMDTYAIAPDKGKQ